MRLDSHMDLDLVVLTFSDVSEGQVETLAAAASQGSISEVGSVEPAYMLEQFCRT